MGLCGLDEAILGPEKGAARPEHVPKKSILETLKLVTVLGPYTATAEEVHV